MSNRRKSTSVPTLQASPQALSRMLEEREPINPGLKLRLKEVFDRYESLIKDSSTRLTTNRYRVNADSAFDTAPSFLRGDGFDHVRTFSPIELISAGLLVCYHMDKRTNAQLLNDVMGMRRHLRVNHKDLRVNAQCWATVWEFILSIGNSDNTISAVIETSSSCGAAQRKQPATSKPMEVSKNTKETVASRSSPPGNRGPRSSPGEKEIPKSVTSKTKTKSSRANKVSALGQSRAGFEVNGKSNRAGRAKGNRHGQSGANSKNTSGKTSRAPSRRSTRSSVAAAPENTVDMSPRLTTGWDETATAGDGTATSNPDAGVDTGTHPANAIQFFDESDDDESLSSVPSSTFGSPAPEELPVRMRKRNQNASDIGANGIRETKRAKN